MAPCEYCGRLTGAETFMRLGVPAFCRNCRRWPLMFGLGWLVVALAFFGGALWIGVHHG